MKLQINCTFVMSYEPGVILAVKRSDGSVNLLKVHSYKYK
jgi:hypothetical protein